MSINHNKWMNYAILEAERSKGITGKNPPVGCVIVKNNLLLSSGRTSFSGRPHAEENAINNVKNKKYLSGSTMYVTLEPCAHKNIFGLSCAEIISNSGITEVFVSCVDPDPRTSCKGIKILKKNNIKVYENFMKNESISLYDGFFSRIIYKKPFITLKIACSLDGKIALKNKKSKWITNDLSRNHVHLIRSQNDAIMTTSTTIINDNPEMNCRLNGFENRNPTKVILDRYLKASGNYKIYDSTQNDNIFIYSLLDMENYLNENKSVKKIKIKENFDNRSFFKFIFMDLAEKGINNLLIETGCKINTILLSLSLIDKLIIFRSSKIIGNDGLPFVDNLNFKEMNKITNYKLHNFKYLDDDILEVRKLEK